MAVNEREVRRIAELARLGIEDARVPMLVDELNRILEHMDVLSKVDTGRLAPVEGMGAGAMPLRHDAGPPIPLARTREEFAPELRDGFFTVPRLATHGDPDGGMESGA